MTARHEGADQPHHHEVDRAAVERATGIVVVHLGACMVCALAQTTVLQRGAELDALGDIDSTPAHNRDRLYAETHILYCGEGLRLMLLLGDATLGAAIFD